MSSKQIHELYALMITNREGFEALNETFQSEREAMAKLEDVLCLFEKYDASHVAQNCQVVRFVRAAKDAQDPESGLTEKELGHCWD